MKDNTGFEEKVTSDKSNDATSVGDEASSDVGTNVEAAAHSGTNEHGPSYEGNDGHSDGLLASERGNGVHEGASEADVRADERSAEVGSHAEKAPSEGRRKDGRDENGSHSERVAPPAHSSGTHPEHVAPSAHDSGMHPEQTALQAHEQTVPAASPPSQPQQPQTPLKSLSEFPTEESTFSVTKILITLAIIGGVGFSLYRISKPILRSFATWILRADPTGDEDYYAREIPVEAEKVVNMTMPKHINTIGELKANASVIIHSEINGCIKELHFVEGSNVKKGDLLIKLDDELFQAEYRVHEAQYVAAKSEYDRYEKMRSAGTGSARDFDKVQAEMNASLAKRDSSKAQLRKTEIRAPFDGVIGLIDIGVGSFVQPNQELVTVVDQTPIKVKFGVPGKFVNDVGVGQAVELKVDAYKDRVFRGTVEAVDSYVDSATNCVALRASITNEDGILKAGLFASVSLIIGIQGETITIDESAVERMGEQEFVWVVDRGKARRVPILTGARERGRVEVIAGLNDKHVVITSGQRGLSDGRFVRIINMTQEEVASKKGAAENDGGDGGNSGSSN
ncbi:MAG: efflux RND transporter periplasmic adaptor subunit [Holosporales bacterium]|jgi:membrane fusion protein (multidrug efflux system)|nr:efflux RND transporter periplasmic adaptor subunit [Holosporales bacterium]